MSKPSRSIDNKSRPKSFRFSKTELETLKQQADAAYLNISDYVRQKLFSKEFNEPGGRHEFNPKSKFACDHDKEMMRFMIRAYFYSKELAKRSLEPEYFKQCNEVINEQMKEWGYE